MILHLIETGGPGGAEQMLLRLADEYGQRGFSQLVCLRKEGWLAEEVRLRGLPLEIRPLGRLPDFSWLQELRQIAQIYGVKAIHAHEFAMNVRGGMLAKWLGIPAVATVHGKRYFGDRWARRLAYRLTSRLTNLVAVSEDIRNNLVDLVGISPHRASVIPNGVDTRRFSFNAEKRRIMRARLGVRNNQLLLGTVGSYYPVKGQRFLVDAMQKLTAIAPNVRLVMAGQGPLADELRKQVSEEALERHVQIVGYIEDTPGFLSALDIFVMPSLSEGQPLALLEAAANGRCIVATNVGGISEIITNNESGVLVPPGDVDALANALARLLADPETRHALERNAATVQDHWSIQRTADRYLELLFPI
jgi:glycosyltransferase involved in cell wall biosynthesis